MCPSEKALEVRASVERSESFALGKRFGVPSLLLAYRLEPSFDRDCSSLLGAFSEIQVSTDKDLLIPHGRAGMEAS